VFTGVVPPWRPGTGITYYDEARTRYFGWFPAVPFGRVEGTLTYDGQTRKVKGTGYHDHNWGNTDLSSIMSYWYWGRAHIGKYALIFAYEVTSKAFNYKTGSIFLLAKNDRILVANGNPLTLRTAEVQSHPSGKTFPRKLDFYWKGKAGSVHLALRQPKIIDEFSLLGGLPKWKQVLARLFANPYYFRFLADLELKVDLTGEHSTEHGKSVYELMALR
jgi:predicted secreted hydrolase